MKNTKLYCLFVILIFFVASCQPSPGVKYAEPTATKPLASMTPVPVTPTVVPSATILPTLSSTQMTDVVRDLYMTNGGCDLPCWWGIMPGEDTLQSVYDRFSSFGVVELSRDSDPLDLFSFTTTPPHDLNLYARERWGFNMRVRDGLVEGIITTPAMNRQYVAPTLDSLLENFGEPDEIWVYLVPEISEPPDYNIILFYPRKGILVGWSGSTQVISWTDSGITVSICPQNMTKEKNYPPYFYLWSPNAKKTFLEINNEYLFQQPYRLLSAERSDIDARIFYETYIDSETEECFRFSLP